MEAKPTAAKAILIMVRHWSRDGAVAFDERLVYNSLAGHYRPSEIHDELEKLLVDKTLRISKDQDLDEPFDLLEFRPDSEIPESHNYRFTGYR